MLEVEKRILVMR